MKNLLFTSFLTLTYFLTPFVGSTQSCWSSLSDTVYAPDCFYSNNGEYIFQYIAAPGQNWGITYYEFYKLGGVNDSLLSTSSVVNGSGGLHFTGLSSGNYKLVLTKITGLGEYVCHTVAYPEVFETPCDLNISNFNLVTDPDNANFLNYSANFSGTFCFTGYEHQVRFKVNGIELASTNFQPGYYEDKYIAGTFREGNITVLPGDEVQFIIDNANENPWNIDPPECRDYAPIVNLPCDLEIDSMVVTSNSCGTVSIKGKLITDYLKLKKHPTLNSFVVYHQFFQFGIYNAADNLVQQSAAYDSTGVFSFLSTSAYYPAGNYTIKWNLGNCYYEYPFEVPPAPGDILDLEIDSVCWNEEPFALGGGLPSGGVYSGNGVVSNMFNPLIAGIGVHTINYTTTSYGCSHSSSALLVVTVDTRDFVEEACTSYTYNGQTFTESGNYIITIANELSCDSIINLNLTIIESCNDCAGIEYGTAFIDDCGICTGGNTGLVPNESCTDCEGVINGYSLPGEVCYIGSDAGIYNADCECVSVIEGSLSGHVSGLSNGLRNITISIYNSEFPELNEVFTTTIDTSGNFFTASFSTGTYSILIKIDGYLAKLYTNQIIQSGINNVVFSGFINGDINNSNNVNVSDVSSLNAAFGSVVGGSRYNLMADLNRDGLINVVDVSILNSAFGKVGDSPPLVD